MVETDIQLYNDIIPKVKYFYKACRLDKHEATKGRKLEISIPEIIALSIFKHKNGIPTKKAIHDIFQPDCSYKTLVVNMNRFARFAAFILLMMLKINQANQHVVKHTDPTDLPVCSNRKAKHHKTMEGLASWGRTGKGSFFGLKLHITTDLNKRLLALRFTTGATDDREVFMDLNKNFYGIFIADAGYVSQKLAYEFHTEENAYSLSNQEKT